MPVAADFVGGEVFTDFRTIESTGTNIVVLYRPAPGDGCDMVFVNGGIRNNTDPTSRNVTIEVVDETATTPFMSYTISMGVNADINVTGTATSGAGKTLTDTSKNFTTLGVRAGVHCIRFTGGTGAGQEALISSVSGNSLTLQPYYNPTSTEMDVPADATTTYEIYSTPHSGWVNLMTGTNQPWSGHTPLVFSSKDQMGMRFIIQGVAAGKTVSVGTMWYFIKRPPVVTVTRL